jgi:hypothetical protein
LTILFTDEPDLDALGVSLALMNDNILCPAVSGWNGHYGL